MAEKKETKTVKATTKKEPTKTTKKATEKKVTEKKVAEKKAPAKKAPAKKATTKKTTAKEAVVMKTMADYVDVINWKKWEAHHMSWLYIEVNAGDLLAEVETGTDNIETCCKAILDCMLEGDAFIVEPTVKNKVENSLTVRYYVDNLSPERKKY